MARITAEQIEQINEVYYETHNKALTARTVGVSAATVSRYIQSDYVPKAQRQESNFDKEAVGSDNFIKNLIEDDNPLAALFNALSLSSEEWADLKELAKEIYL